MVKSTVLLVVNTTIAESLLSNKTHKSRITEVRDVLDSHCRHLLSTGVSGPYKCALH